jgi:hypothetical protein
MLFGIEKIDGLDSWILTIGEERSTSKINFGFTLSKIDMHCLSTMLKEKGF